MPPRSDTRPAALDVRICRVQDEESERAAPSNTADHAGVSGLEDQQSDDGSTAVTVPRGPGSGLSAARYTTVTQSFSRSPSMNWAVATKQSPEAAGAPRQSQGAVVVTTPVKRSLVVVHPPMATLTTMATMPKSGLRTRTTYGAGQQSWDKRLTEMPLVAGANGEAVPCSHGLRSGWYEALLALDR